MVDVGIGEKAGIRVGEHESLPVAKQEKKRKRKRDIGWREAVRKLPGASKQVSGFRAGQESIYELGPAGTR